MSLPPETLVTDAELAALVGVSARRIRQLAESGTLERAERGRYQLGPAVRALLEQASGSGSELQRERIRKLRADADLAELELAKQRGEVAPIEEAEAVWGRFCGILRTNMMQIPARAVLQLLGCTDETEFKAKLADEIKLALAAAAEINPENEDIDE